MVKFRAFLLAIGVIMLTMNAKGLLEKVGVEATAVISGPRKDMDDIADAWVKVYEHRDALRAWAKAGTSNGNHLWM